MTRTRLLLSVGVAVALVDATAVRAAGQARVTVRCGACGDPRPGGGRNHTVTRVDRAAQCLVGRATLARRLGVVHRRQRLCTSCWLGSRPPPRRRRELRGVSVTTFMLLSLALRAVLRSVVGWVGSGWHLGHPALRVCCLRRRPSEPSGVLWRVVGDHLRRRQWRLRGVTCQGTWRRFGRRCKGLWPCAMHAPWQHASRSRV